MRVGQLLAGAATGCWGRTDAEKAVYQWRASLIAGVHVPRFWPEYRRYSVNSRPQKASFFCFCFVKVNRGSIYRHKQTQGWWWGGRFLWHYFLQHLQHAMRKELSWRRQEAILQLVMKLKSQCLLAPFCRRTLTFMEGLLSVCTRHELRGRQDRYACTWTLSSRGLDKGVAVFVHPAVNGRVPDWRMLANVGGLWRNTGWVVNTPHTGGSVKQSAEYNVPKDHVLCTRRLTRDPGFEETNDVVFLYLIDGWPLPFSSSCRSFQPITLLARRSGQLKSSYLWT